MDAFKTHEKVISDYRSYLSSFLSIHDERIQGEVSKSLNDDGFLPEPLVQFNPSFETGKPLAEIKGINPKLPNIFGDYNLYRHQIEAIELGINGEGFIVTSGTGSGKSLTYLATIFNSILNRAARKKGVKAILVYPMNALINSQEEEIKKYAEKFGNADDITFGKYTGQESTADREAMKSEVPDIILTNYMMLELIMTRQGESWLRESISNNLDFLVFDELHTYRGRQGSDVSLLIRRIKGLAEKRKVICIGTSATMASKGTPIDKKRSVAAVGNTIFGENFTEKNVVGEYLKHCTEGRQIEREELIRAMKNGIDQNADEAVFVSHPMSNWLESEIALRLNEDVLERGMPKRISQIAKELAGITDSDPDELRALITDLLKWTERLNEDLRKRNSRKTFLPFRFHQFISQTSVVSVTLESREDREITIKPGKYIKKNQRDMPLYPILFSRTSGYDFICVEKKVDDNKLLPRNPDDPIESLTLKDAKGKNLSEEDFKAGYIVFDDGEDFWDDNPLEYVLDSWMNTAQTELKPFYSFQVPQRIYFDSEGNYSSSKIYPYSGFFISAKLRIDPTAGIVYEDVKTSENTKLMRIGNEGRSTATTIISYSVIDSLFHQNEKVFDQKLLSFTDNRQDASLQAGHFNDFIATIRLRSALHHTLNKHPEGLNVHNIVERLYETLSLDEDMYAKQKSENPKYPDVENTKALKSYLLLRVLQDLKRGWRYTLPNLEQTGLLRLKYNQLHQLKSDEEEFEGIELLKAMPPDQREDCLTQVLNYFRTNLALDHRMLLDDRGEVENLLRNKLDEKKLWSLDHNERVDSPRYLTVFNPGRTQRGIYTSSIGPRSGLGKFLKRMHREQGLIVPDTEGMIGLLEGLCEMLTGVGLLSRNDKIRGDKTGSDGVKGYLLRTDCLTWLPGDGETVSVDQTRINSFREVNIKPNQYFQKLYKTEFTQYEKELEGREHTGQIGSEDRIERENHFREGKISAMFCSPTMELGIDIANLNIVHMRNVPPNPANYAQRSGRAGRSGQTAVVFTYCSSMSPHDQNYFKESETMVAGSVIPPRIDLLNEELIRSHFHAYILMELELGALHTSVSTLVDLDNSKELPLLQSVHDQIENNLSLHKRKWTAHFKQYIEGILPELHEMWWYRDEWFAIQADAFLKNFDEAFSRWRNLYKSAKRLIEQARVVLDDPTVISSSEQNRDAKRQHNVGLVQIDLLKNDKGFSYGGQSEFYVFRYLASEGFIPGYNFTRLPVRAFVGWKHQDQGEYISRPRSIALREFGPDNLIYHNGNRHRVTRMMMTDAEALQRKIKISDETGYAFLDTEASTANNDPITRAELKGGNFEYRSKLIEMSEVEANPQMRISCEEEDRLSKGFEIDNYFNYAAGIEQTKKSVVQSGGQPLLNLIYGPATNLIALNRQWRKSPSEGFSIDKRNGKWLRQKDLENDENKANEEKVMIFAQDTADTLYIQPLENLELSPDEIITLSYALKRGIEVLFQVEESEIGVSIIGKKESPNVMIYESAQGSLGVLSLLSSEPTKLKELFKTSYRCMHFDPETREETDYGMSLPKATYEDLLSYYNQRHHEILDRHSIKAALEYLMDCDVSSSKNGKNRDEQYEDLLEAYDKNSSTELKMLRYLYENCLALPDRAQVNVPEFYISADFVYDKDTGPVLIFCDGSVHDQANVQEDDRHKRELLVNKGYDIVEWHYMEPLEELVKRRKDVFRKVC
ncbi:MAG: DEAD/DEAH box helicase [Cryomorphaceae bacterium]